ncbi:peptidase C19, ubiquitin carboxyl-terminal hydrolase 2 [Clavulina sp. PMI_390]|nr:peptidase C19, ubiquitin carboxyl-terminal hydrolase 2 [Clavulina sp. PMI_390]
MFSRKDKKRASAARAPTAQAVEEAQLPPGIQNLANDCFANSVLQALVATHKLEDVVQFREHVGEGVSGDPALSPALTNGRKVAGDFEREWTEGLKLSDTFLQFMDAAYRVRTGRTGQLLTPRPIIKTLGVKFDQYLDFRQQDAQEFLRHLLDAMYMDEMDIAKKRQAPVDPKLARKKTRRASYQPQSRSAANSPSRDHTPSEGKLLEEARLEPFASTVFGGRLASFIVCDTCKNISHTYEDIMDLSLPIKADEAKKKGSFRAFMGKLVSGGTQSAAPSATPSRSTTPIPPPVISPPLVPVSTNSSTSSDPPSDLSLGAPNSHFPADSPASGAESTTSLATAETSASTVDSGYVSQLGRRVSKRLSMSRERIADSLVPGVGAAATPGSQPRSRSRPVSMDGRSTSAPSVPTMQSKPKEKPKSSGPRKPTANEQAYLRALLRDDSATSNPLALLRGGLPSSGHSHSHSLSSSHTFASPSSGRSHSWGRMGTPASSTILDCMRMFTGVEMLDGDNAFACHNCWKIAHPAEVEAARGRRRERRRRGRRRRGAANGDEDEDEDSDDSDSDYGDDGDDSATDDLRGGPDAELSQKRAQTASSGRPAAGSNGPSGSSDGFLRPDFASARALSVDAGIAKPSSGTTDMVQTAAMLSLPSSPRLQPTGESKSMPASMTSTPPPLALSASPSPSPPPATTSPSNPKAPSVVTSTLPANAPASNAMSARAARPLPQPPVRKSTDPPNTVSPNKVSPPAVDHSFAAVRPRSTSPANAASALGAVFFAKSLRSPPAEAAGGNTSASTASITSAGTTLTPILTPTPGSTGGEKDKFPFPTLAIPSIATTSPSPDSETPSTAVPFPTSKSFGSYMYSATTPRPDTLTTPTQRSQSRHQRQSAEDEYERSLEVDDGAQIGGSGVNTGSGENVPRFRRFSSFHADKLLLSPNISRESLASAPPEERMRRELAAAAGSRTGSDNALASDTEDEDEGASLSGVRREGEPKAAQLSSTPEPGSLARVDTAGTTSAPSIEVEDTDVEAGEATEDSKATVTGSEPPVRKGSTLGPLMSFQSRKHTSWVPPPAPLFEQGSAPPLSQPIAKTTANTAAASRNAVNGSSTAQPQSKPQTTLTKRADQVILRNAFKRYLIDAPPPVLVIHLKRFQQVHFSGAYGYGGYGGGASTTLFAGTAKKLEDYISFPEYLDMRPFLAPRKERYGVNERGRTPRATAADKALKPRGAANGHHIPSLSGKNLDEEEPPVMYRLYAVVVHIGSMLGGHYIAYTALPQPDLAPSSSADSGAHSKEKDSAKDHQHLPPRQWAYISDTIVKLTTIDEVLKSKAYLLFYERLP